MNKKILVIGGMHGNERLGVELVSMLKARKIRDVDAVIANPRAVKQNVRYIEADLNRSFGPGHRPTLETTRAKELYRLTKKYDLILDFHNTMTAGNDCSFVGPVCDPLLFEASKKLGLMYCIEATYDCINKFCPNTLSIEVSQNGALDDAGYWYEKINKLWSLEEGLQELLVYRFARRVTWEEAANNDIKGWSPFVPLSARDTQVFGLKEETVPIFIGSKLTEYYATLVTLSCAQDN